MICFRCSGVIAPTWLRGGTNLGPVDDPRFAFVIEHRDERFAHAQLRDDGLDLELGILPKRLRGGRDRLLIARREGAQGMLDAVPQLAQDNIGNIERILADEINADAFRADQSHHLLDLLRHRRLDVVEEQVRFVEEENELGLFRIANFREPSRTARKATRAERSRKLSATVASAFPPPGY